MKRVWNMAMAVVFLMGMTISAQAGSTAINFDETGIDTGDIITTQYETDGVTWSESHTNEITTGSAFDNPFVSDGQIIYYTDKAGLIQLDSLAKNLSFEIRRPDKAADISLKLYNTTAGEEPELVNDFGRIGWDGPNWETFSYDGSNGNFDQIEITSGKKFVMDNLAIDWAGACYLEGEICTEVTEEECVVAGGVYQGDGTICNSPVADAGPDQFAKDGTVELDGSNSEDPNGVIASYDWTVQNIVKFWEVKDFAGETATVSGLEKGIYGVTLTVTDDDGLIGTDTMTVTSCFISTLR